MTKYYSHAKQIQILREGIENLKTKGRPYDYLEDRLGKLLGQLPQKNEVDIFVLKPLSSQKITPLELMEMNYFGYVLKDNPLTRNPCLEKKPDYARYLKDKHQNKDLLF